MKNFVTIAIFNYPHEITVLRHWLEQEQINFFFENETMTNITPMYSLALGGIKLKVHQDDVAAAQIILDEFDNGNHHLKIV